MKEGNSKKIRDSILAGGIVIFYYLFILGCLFYFQFVSNEEVPWLFFIVINLLLLALVISIVMALVSRIKEIKGGEEDEASKY